MPLSEGVSGLDARGDWQVDTGDALLGPRADFAAIVLRLDDHS